MGVVVSVRCAEVVGAVLVVGYAVIIGKNLSKYIKRLTRRLCLVILSFRASR